MALKFHGGVALAAALLLSAGTASAHHSFAAFFDSGNTVKITGKVTDFRFTNPHGSIGVEVKKPDGTVEQWRAETNAPVVLLRRGWKRNSLKPGDTVTLEGWGSRDGKPYMRLRQAFDADGKRIGSAPFGQNDEK